VPKAAASSSFFWHDYETFGASSTQDYPAQFAGLRTDTELQPHEEAPLDIFCQPPPAYLPEPQACAITGITPQYAQRIGVPEPEFATRIHSELSQPGTISAGYNSMRFDEEFTRQLFWRNGLDVYTREYANGNARFDLIDVLRMAYALRPEGMAWATLDGRASFKLSALSAENKVTHEQAHNALSDVHATIALARLLKNAQPKLWAHALSMRHKASAAALLDYLNAKPVLHVSQRFSAERGCLAMVLPIAVHPNRSNQIIVVDLDTDPSALIALDADEIADRLYVASADLPADELRLPLKLVHLNRCPMLAPLSALKGVDCTRIRLDVERNAAHAEQLKAALPALQRKLRVVYAQDAAPAPPVSAAWPRELPALYQGFVPPQDRQLLQALQKLDAAARAAWLKNMPRFADERLRPLLKIYQARHFPHSLSAEEQAQALHAAQQNLQFGARSLTRFHAQLDALAQDGGVAPEVLDALRAFGMAMQQEYGLSAS
jgi:exodeoxyribonuclease I